MSDWYCLVAGEVLGPKSAGQIRGMARTGSLSGSDQVRKGIDGKWVPAFEVKGIFGDATSQGSKVISESIELDQCQEELSCEACGSVTPWLRTKRFYLGKTIPADGYTTQANASTGELHFQYILLKEWDVRICRECLTNPLSNRTTKQVAADNHNRHKRMMRWAFATFTFGLGGTTAVAFLDAILLEISIGWMAIPTVLIGASSLVFWALSDPPAVSTPEEHANAVFQTAATEALRRNMRKELDQHHVICDETAWNNLLSLQADGVFMT